MLFFLSQSVLLAKFKFKINFCIFSNSNISGLGEGEARNPPERGGILLLLLLSHFSRVRLCVSP